MSTRYAESLVAIKYRVEKEGKVVGGAMYVLERGLGMKWLAVLFAIFTVLASLGIGNTVQSNAMSTLLHNEMGVESFVTGGVAAFMVALVIIFGLKGIARVSALLVPFMAIFYIGGSLVLLFINREVLGETISLIFTAAFTIESFEVGVVGGGVIMAMRYGVARGLFSNEAGMGSIPIVAAASRNEDQVRSALISATGTFWDTVVICAITGLVVVSSVVADPNINYSDGALLTQMSFARLPYGSLFLTVTLVCFTFTTILSWSYYAEKALEYLLKWSHSIIIFRLCWVGMVFVGATASLDLIWNFADIMNALMTLPNIISLLLLAGVIKEVTRTKFPRL